MMGKFWGRLNARPMHTCNISTRIRQVLTNILKYLLISNISLAAPSAATPTWNRPRFLWTDMVHQLLILHERLLAEVAGARLSWLVRRQRPLKVIRL